MVECSLTRNELILDSKLGSGKPTEMIRAKQSAPLSADVNAGLDFNVFLEKSHRVTRRSKGMKDKQVVVTKVDRSKVNIKAKATVVVKLMIVLALTLAAAGKIANAPSHLRAYCQNGIKDAA